MKIKSLKGDTPNYDRRPAWVETCGSGALTLPGLFGYFKKNPFIYCCFILNKCLQFIRFLK